MTTHELKIEESYFEAIADGRKNFEIRLNDRGFQAGDSVILQEIYTKNGTYTGRQIKARIGYVIGYMQKDNYVVFSLLDVKEC